MVVVVYHFPCLDGWLAAMAAWQALGDEAHLVPYHHGSSLADPVPAFREGAVAVHYLDVTPPAELLIQQLEQGREVVILDHHDSALRRLPELQALGRSTGRLTALVDPRAAACLHAWRTYMGDAPVPALYRYVDDRDRWVWALDQSQAVSAYLAAVPFYAAGEVTTAQAFARWLELQRQLDDPDGHAQAQGVGRVLLGVQQQQVTRQLAAARMGEVAGVRVPVVNVTAYHSEVLAALLQAHPQAPFVAGYRDEAQTRHWSLRTQLGRGVDVALLAEALGGAGHTLAAGFEEPLPPSSLGPVRLDQPQAPKKGRRRRSA